LKKISRRQDHNFKRQDKQIFLSLFPIEKRKIKKKKQLSSPYERSAHDWGPFLFFFVLLLLYVSASWPEKVEISGSCCDCTSE
jgi:hypothetical protein